MIIKTLKSAQKIEEEWNNDIKSIYQTKNFLIHLETYNPCSQRYYVCFDNGHFVAGAVVYSQHVNILTFSKFHLKLPMSIIGLPVSVDAGGIVGDPSYFNELIASILEQESGIVLCLNYTDSLQLESIIEMQTLPSMVFDAFGFDWSHYMQQLRHTYRRRVLQAQKKIEGAVIIEDECSQFTDDHYKLYLNIMHRTKTKLEILTKVFFNNLPREFKLYSNYIDGKLLTWHITTTFNNVYYFLFGGINYEYLKKYDSYYNNLINIVKEGLATNAASINLGQTAEISKLRLGAHYKEKKMFLFHKNRLIRSIFFALKNTLSHKINNKESRIFKTIKHENFIHTAETSI